MSKEDLIRNLISGGHLDNSRIRRAFEEVDRKDFILKEFEARAYLNEPVPIGHGQTISQPLTVAFMLDLLNPQPGEKILDIGAGSGWQTALLANLVGESGKVIAIERILPLKAFAEDNLKKLGLLESGRVKIIWKNAAHGFKEEAPYDKIIAAASADAVPKEWQDQLKIGGRIVAPLEGSIVVIDKKAEKEYATKEYFGFRFVPLVQE